MLSILLLTLSFSWSIYTRRNGLLKSSGNLLENSQVDTLTLEFECSNNTVLVTAKNDYGSSISLGSIYCTIVQFNVNPFFFFFSYWGGQKVCLVFLFGQINIFPLLKPSLFLMAFQVSILDFPQANSDNFSFSFSIFLLTLSLLTYITPIFIMDIPI